MAYFLQKDLNSLDKQIKATEERIRTAIKIGAESTQQSSETWHDNFDFEDTARQQKMLSRQLAELQDLKRRAVLVEPAKTNEKVRVGCNIKLLNLDTNESREFLIGSYMVFEKISPVEVSYIAPIVAPFYEAGIGDIYEVSLSGKLIEFELVEISTNGT